jgi:ATP-dependent Clp protease ATP-binding subunit ClpB
MTSNVGSDIIQDYMLKINGVNKEQALEDCKGAVMEVLKRSVRPEFLNRIDEVIMFEPLTPDNIRGILMLQIRQIQELLADKGIELSFTDEALEYLASKGYDIAYGARPIKRLLQKELPKVSVMHSHTAVNSSLTERQYALPTRTAGCPGH